MDCIICDGKVNVKSIDCDGDEHLFTCDCCGTEIITHERKHYHNVEKKLTSSNSEYAKCCPDCTIELEEVMCPRCNTYIKIEHFA